MRLLRQIISMLLVVAYLSATIFVTAPTASAAPSEMSGGMMMQHGTNDQMPMPCKGLKTGCVTEARLRVHGQPADTRSHRHCGDRLVAGDLHRVGGISRRALDEARSRPSPIHHLN